MARRARRCSSDTQSMPVGGKDEREARAADGRGDGGDHTVSTMGGFDHSADPITDCQLPAMPHAAPAEYDLPVVPREAYRIERHLRRGGMGRVLRATDLRLQRPVAIKEMLDAG